MCVCEHLISQLEKVRAAYHKSCQKEQTALDKEKQANEDAEMSPEKKRKITNARETATEEKELVSGERRTHCTAARHQSRALFANPSPRQRVKHVAFQ